MPAGIVFELGAGAEGTLVRTWTLSRAGAVEVVVRGHQDDFSRGEAVRAGVTVSVQAGEGFAVFHGFTIREARELAAHLQAAAAFAEQAVGQ